MRKGDEKRGQATLLRLLVYGLAALALTFAHPLSAAPDRPYKKRFPHAEGLGILGRHAKVGKIDADLFNLFIEARICKETLYP